MEKMSITELIKKVHENAVNKGFHNDVKIMNGLHIYGLITLEQNNLLHSVAINSKLALINTELAECTEALRKGDIKNYREELADVAIRVLDLAGLTNVDLEQEIYKKIAKNEKRPYLHGKEF